MLWTRDVSTGSFASSGSDATEKIVRHLMSSQTIGPAARSLLFSTTRSLAVLMII
jgi:hypothetical protein